MDAVFKYLGGHDVVPGSAMDIYWSWLTIALSVFVALGYAAIAYNRYFQSKLARTAQCAAAARRLWLITLFCGLCGSFFYWYDMPWPIWRLYDCVLLFLLYSTWAYAIRMRGLSLVDERLSQLGTLEETARRYREMAEFLPQMVWTARENGEIDFSNQRWAEYVGDGRTWIEAIHPEDRLRIEGWWARTLRTRKVSSIEARLGGAAGYRTFVISANPILSHGAVKWLGACADIQAQKLLAAAREMQAKRRAFFLNALSHDLRAPLNNVVLNAELLKIVPPDEVKTRVVTIVESAKSAGDYVTKLLDFARTGGEEQNRIEPFSLLSVLGQIEQRFRPVAEHKGLFIRVAAEHDIEIRSDRQKLERLISNLVDNAVKYTRAGGVTLAMMARDDQFSVRVTDTGIGVPRDNAPYLFDEFYQVNNTERDRSKGFGMGLAICKYLATQLGGTVRLVSTTEQGSSFEVILPIECPADGGRIIGEASSNSSNAHVCTS
jgi:PAS domain S-box-containing protein